MDESLEDRVREAATRFGFDAVGFAAADLPDAVGDALDAFLDEGRHGEMDWMEETRQRRRHPRAMWPGAVSSITLGMSYAPFGDPLALLDRVERGYISVYARNRDYHDVVKKRLKQMARWIAETFGAEVKVFVDTAPLMEKPLAAQSGVGWQGRHTNVVSRQFGGWLFLGHILTSLPLKADAPQPSLCGSCRRCVVACSTGALDGAFRIDPRRCISYLTIENPGPIPLALRPMIGNRIYGCDDCLGVCPWNRFAPATRHPDLMPRIELIAPRLADLATLDEATFRLIFSGSPIKRIGRDRFVRNVLIALGNGGDASALAVVTNLRDDPAEVVAGAAIWAWSRLAPHATVGAEARRRLEEDGGLSPLLRAEWEAVVLAFDHGRAASEDGRADPHMGGPKGDSQIEIAAHPHTEER